MKTRFAKQSVIPIVRNDHGVAVTVLNILIAVVVAGIVVAICYEMARLILARSQLTTCVEAAALSGELTLLSGKAITDRTRSDAEEAALNIFRKNTILGAKMTSASKVESPQLLAPPVGQAQLCFEYLEPSAGAPAVTTRAPLTTRAASTQSAVVNSQTENSQTATSGSAQKLRNLLHVTGAFNYPVLQGLFLGAGASSYTITVSTTTSLPALDLVIVFDLSQSLDDQTNVTMVDRHWDKHTVPGETAYEILRSAANGKRAQGTIQELVCAPAMGSRVNVLPAQNLEAAMNAPFGCAKYFSEVVSGYNGLRGSINSGKPPGDCPNASEKGVLGARFREPPVPSNHQLVVLNRSSSRSIPAVFTDLVANLDGRTIFAGYSAMGYHFPTVAALVEASRGNLDSEAMALSARVPLKSDKMKISARSGFQSAYTLLAAGVLQPLRTVERSESSFMAAVSERTNCHFGFVGFSDRAGQSSSDSVEVDSVSSAYPVAGRGDLPLPLIKLKSTPQSSNYNTIVSLLNPPDSFVNPAPAFVLPIAGTNIADGIKTALDELTDTGARSGATKAVVLITDGVPTEGLSFKQNPLFSPANQACCDARAQARRAYNLGIPIFVVALSQSEEPLRSWQNMLYNDVDARESDGGLAAISGHGARYYRCKWVDPISTKSDLDEIFDNIVSALTALTR